MSGTLALTAEYSWWTDLFTHFRVQIAMLSVLSLALTIYLGLRCFSVIAALAIMASLMPLFAVPNATSTRIENANLKILSWNVYYLNDETKAAVEEIRSLNPDILVLSEASPHWRTALKALDSEYPFQHHADSCDDVGCQVSLMSKIPWLSVSSEKFVIDTPPVIWAKFAGVDDGPPFHLFAVHLRKAISADGAMRQRKQTIALGEIVRRTPGTKIMAGDMNATPTSAAYHRLVSATGLEGADVSLLATWPKALGPLGLAIDHFFATEDVAVDVRRLNYWSSDHRMILGRVSFQRE